MQKCYCSYSLTKNGDRITFSELIELLQISSTVNAQKD
jgi:hypothetical protein